MMTRRLKRILAFLMACALLASTGCQALAASVYVKSSAAVYDSPQASARMMTSLKAGTKLELLAEKSGWAKVEKGGKTGYMRTSDLVRIESCSLTAYTKSATTVYKSFTGGSKLGTIDAGEQVTVTAKVGSAACITYGKFTGYVKTSALTTKAPAAATEQQPQAQETAVTQVASRTVYVAREGAKVYNASGKAVGTLGLNTALTLTATKDDICRVEKGGKTAYMYKSDLSDSKLPEAEEKPEEQPAQTSVEETKPLNTTAYVNKDGAKVYNASGKAAGKLNANTQLTVLEVNGNVCKVTNGSTVAYMKKEDLSTSKVEVSAPQTIQCTTVYVKTDGAKAYNANGKAVAQLALNTELTVTGINGDVVRVSRDGATAYMHSCDLSCEKVDTGVVDIPDTTGYVNKASATVVDAQGNTIATLSLNTAVTVTAYKDSLCRVTSGGNVGYMKKDDISAEKVDETKVSLKFGDTGDAVKKLQTRLKELGYFSGTVGGNYQSLTQSAVAAFQSVAKLTSNGQADTETLALLFSDKAPKKPSDNNAATSNGPTGNSTVTPAKGTAIEMDWWTSDIQNIFARGVTAQITDVETGLSWREQRRGGYNHADVQPLTAADTAALKKAYGGKWSWNRRAIFVTINGVNYAASMNGMPHGGGSITNNNFDGHHCIHFTNSRTHGSNKVCSLHQAAIKKALAANLG